MLKFHGSLYAAFGRNSEYQTAVPSMLISREQQ